MFRLARMLVVAGSLTAVMSNAWAQSPTKLRFAVQTPPQMIYNQGLFVPWAKKVTEDSKGTLSVEMFFAGTLGNEGQYVDLVKQGVADIALDITAYYPGRFPLTDAVSLPLLVDKSEPASVALWQAYENGKFGHEFDGMKMLAMTTSPSATLMTTQKAGSEPADYKGLKLAGGGKIKGEMITAIGAAPVNIKISELYQSLSRHTVDGAMTYYTALPVFKLNEVGKHYLDVPLGGSFMMVFMSQSRFDALPEDAKKAIEMNSGSQFSRSFGALWDRANEQGRKLAVSSGGVIHTPNAEQLNNWDKVMSPIIDNWTASVEGGKAVVEALRGGAN